MNKTHFLLLLILFVFFSCIEEKRTNALDTLDKMNSVSVIIDDQLWNGEVGDTLRNKFASPVLGLQEEEPLFILNQYPVKLLDGFLTKSRNIIIVKKETQNKFSITENEHTKPQIIAHISGRNVQEIVDSIEVKYAIISKKIRESEIVELQKEIHNTASKTNDINEKFKIKISVSSKYKTVLKSKKFLWLKKEITSGNLSLLAYQVPINRLKDSTNVVNTIVKIRDSIGRKYIHGSRNRTRMITETAFTPYLTKFIFGEKQAYEVKGTWDLQNDFMSGPFVNYAIIDKENNRILILEGFCYAPSKGKRDLMLELESIIKTVQF